MSIYYILSIRKKCFKTLGYINIKVVNNTFLLDNPIIKTLSHKYFYGNITYIYRPKKFLRMTHSSTKTIRLKSLRGFPKLLWKKVIFLIHLVDSQRLKPQDGYPVLRSYKWRHEARVCVTKGEVIYLLPGV